VKQVPRALAHLVPALEELRLAERLRTRAEPVGELSFCSNDYLGLAHTPAPSAQGGAGASRLIAGEHQEHARLERLIAEWLDAEQALLFSSGYAANVGVIQALVGPGDLVVSDALNHASIIDGLRMTRAEVVVIPHLDTAAVGRALAGSQRRAWVTTETYFSMDADSPDLGALRRICDETGAGLIVDEAHAFGVLGPEGRGLCAAAGVEAVVRVGTLGKTFGAAGAFVVGCKPLVDWLWNRARSHVFSTGMSPVVTAAARANVERALRDPHLRERAVRNADRFREALRAAGLDVRGHGPIVPWVLGAEVDALRVAANLRERGVHAVAIRPPTVPEGTSRIRFAFTARHTDEDVARAIEAARNSFT
jgi:8-amino-7-oxononanoate synthase